MSESRDLSNYQDEVKESYSVEKMVANGPDDFEWEECCGYPAYERYDEAFMHLQSHSEKAFFRLRHHDGDGRVETLDERDLT